LKRQLVVVVVVVVVLLLLLFIIGDNTPLSAITGPSHASI